MRHFLLLGLQVGEGVRIRQDFTGELGDHRDAMFRQSSGFARIVREQTNFFDAEIAHDRRGQAEEIGREPQGVIGLNRIKASILQFVCLQLCHQANAAAFLILINHQPATFFGDGLHGHFQLIATVATQRAEHFSGKALRMNSQQRNSTSQIAHDERERCLSFSSAIGDMHSKPMASNIPHSVGMRVDAIRQSAPVLTPRVPLLSERCRSRANRRCRLH
jgi:hypothetical protein